MPKYIDIYKSALQKYIAQAERIPFTLAGKEAKRIYVFGLFSKLRHSQTEYPSLQTLRAQLEKDSSETQFDLSQLPSNFKKLINHDAPALTQAKVR